MGEFIHTCGHIVIHALKDTLVILPFLFAVYLLVEYLEHKASSKLANSLTKLGPFGAVGGAVLGCVPQCGFSVMAANLFSGRLISMGTLIAVFISTSDEAIPIMVSNPEKIGDLWKLIVCKVVIAVVVGIAVDLIGKAFFKKQDSVKPFEQLCTDCGCHHHSIWRAALKHSVSIIIFIFIVNLLLGGAIEFIGEDNIKVVLMTDSFFQPFIAAIIGFIPNCAASVILTELYIEGVLSFGSIIAGLCTGAGVGLLVLFKTNKKMKQNIAIVGILYVSAVVSGILINLIL